jgi:o-succinylbenzoate---CoA ligase
VTRALASRTAVVLAPRFDPAEVAGRIAESRVTLASFVPAMLHAVLERGGGAALASLRAILIGGAAFPSGLRARARDAGIRALATYGLTETASQIATQAPGDPIAVDAALVGRPLPGARVAIRDGVGEPLAAGRRGRIWVAGPMLMRGYAGAPPLAPETWLETGDEGSLGADGALSVFGRADDTIVTGGENVDPTDVESALGAIAGVRDVAVFGVLDPVWGHVVAAALVLDAGRDPRAVCAAAAGELAPFKRPRLMAVLDALPRTATGKIDRRGVAAAASPLLAPIRGPSPREPL